MVSHFAALATLLCPGLHSHSPPCALPEGGQETELHVGVHGQTVGVGAAKGHGNCRKTVEIVYDTAVGAGWRVGDKL